MPNLSSLLAQASKGRWRVRQHPVNEDQFFVEADRNSTDQPYDIEVLSEDAGGPDSLYPITQRRADAELIVAAINQLKEQYGLL